MLVDFELEKTLWEQIPTTSFMILSYGVITITSKGKQLYNKLPIVVQFIACFVSFICYFDVLYLFTLQKQKQQKLVAGYIRPVSLSMYNFLRITNFLQTFKLQRRIIHFQMINFYKAYSGEIYSLLSASKCAIFTHFPNL